MNDDSKIALTVVAFFAMFFAAIMHGCHEVEETSRTAFKQGYCFDSQNAKWKKCEKENR